MSTSSNGCLPASREARKEESAVFSVYPRRQRVPHFWAILPEVGILTSLCAKAT